MEITIQRPKANKIICLKQEEIEDAIKMYLMERGAVTEWDDTNTYYFDWHSELPICNVTIETSEPPSKTTTNDN